MDRGLAKRWLAGHIAAERRAREVMRAEGPPTPAIAFEQSMELLDLAPAEDPFRERDVAHARAAWAKLRAWAASRGQG
jgi:hypothetical protein